jgi:hypothetical protein
MQQFFLKIEVPGRVAARIAILSHAATCNADAQAQEPPMMHKSRWKPDFSAVIYRLMITCLGPGMASDAAIAILGDDQDFVLAIAFMVLQTLADQEFRPCIGSVVHAQAMPKPVIGRKFGSTLTPVKGSCFMAA